MLFLALVVTLFAGAFFARHFMRMIINDHAMAVLNLCLHHCIAAIAGVTALDAKYLRTRDNQNGQRGEDAFAEK